MDWEIYSEGIYRVPKCFQAYDKNIELIITETGAAFPGQPVEGRVEDTDRIQFIQKYLLQVLEAKQEGVNVKG